MRHVFFALFLCLLTAIWAVPVSAQQEAKTLLTLDDIHYSSTYSVQSFTGGRWAEQGPIIWFVEYENNGNASHLMSFNLETNQREKLIDGSKLFAEDVNQTIKIENYEYSKDASKVLIYTDSERVWRQNTKGYYYLFDLASETLLPISDRTKGFQMFAKLSPDGERVAFVRDRNLFMVNLNTGVETQLTSDGEDGSIINGTSDWVYEEEFRLRDGWAWSPDGRFIAFYKFDESGTRDFFMTDLLQKYPVEEEFRYPKAGEINSEIQLGIVDIMTNQIAFFDTDTWFEGADSTEYIPQMGWTPAIDGTQRVWMIRLNRDQNVLDLLYGHPETMATEIILHEEEPSWIDVNSGKIQYLDDNKHFVWMSETDGYRHIYIHTNTGERVRQVTKGDWEVTNFAGIDENKGMIYFTAAIDTPLERQLYAISYKNKSSAPERITEKGGTHSINLSRDAQYFIDTYSNSTTPPLVTLHSITGEQRNVLESNEKLAKNLEKVAPAEPEFITLPAADGTSLNAFLIKPKNFNPEAEYPLLMYVYGGPGSQTVRNSWGGSRYLWHAMLADELDIIVASVDNRGTGARGKAFESATYKKLGQLEAADQIAAAHYLGNLAYIDKNRIGIWGWSYGGYMTLMAMLFGDGPGTFKFGVSVAPVTDWELYDTIYTERYMSTPQKNREGYSEGAPLNYAANLAPHQRLLLVHGDFDDNVHFQNAAQMANELQYENKQFEFMMYPGRNHGIFGGKTRLHLHTMMTRFIQDALNEPTVSSSVVD